MQTVADYVLTYVNRAIRDDAKVVTFDVRGFHVSECAGMLAWIQSHLALRDSLTFKRGIAYRVLSQVDTITFELNNPIDVITTLLDLAAQMTADDSEVVFDLWQLVFPQRLRALVEKSAVEFARQYGITYESQIFQSGSISVQFLRYNTLPHDDPFPSVLPFLED